MDNFSTIIKEARKAKKISQRDLAKMLGCSQTCVAFWELNVRVPSLQTTAKICKILDIDGNYALGLIRKEEVGLRPDHLDEETRILMAKVNRLNEEERAIFIKLVNQVLISRTS